MVDPAPPLNPLLAQCLQDAAVDGATLIVNLTDKARQSLMFRTDQALDINERRLLAESLDLLDKNRRTLETRFSDLLKAEFDEDLSPRKSKSVASLSFGELQLMDDHEVQEKVEVGRMQQIAVAATDAELTELNAFVSGLQGLATIQADRNPLRPEVYIRALREGLNQLSITPTQRLALLQGMAQAMGRELRSSYQLILQRLRGQGVRQAGYAIIQAPSGGSGPTVRGAGGWQDQAYNSAEAAAALQGSGAVAAVGAGPGGLAMPLRPGFNAVGQSAPDMPRAGTANAAAIEALAGIGSGAPGGAGAQNLRARLLTVDQLRRLLTGEFNPSSPGLQPGVGSPGMALGPAIGYATGPVPGGVAAPAALRGAGPAPAAAPLPLRPDGSVEFGYVDKPEFASTVPAAYEALEEMRQIDQVMARFAQKRLVAQQAGARVVDHTDSVATLKAMAVGRDTDQIVSAGDSLQLGQALGLEVVSLMMESIGRNTRLLPVLRETLLLLNRPLMSLAMVDPRFFSDRRHPARRLLEEVTQRGMAFTDNDSPEFRAFMQPIIMMFDQLAVQPVHGGEPFQWVIDTLTRLWSEGDRSREAAREEMAEALMEVEKRNRVASEVSRELRARPDVLAAPAVLREFICGPWAHAIALARIEDPRGEAGADGCEALVGPLLWSVNLQATLTENDRLVRLIPTLLANLRSGLKKLGVPTDRVSLLMDLLMSYHQQALRLDGLTPEVHEAAEAARSQIIQDLERLTSGGWFDPADSRYGQLLDLSEAGQVPKGIGDFDDHHTAPDELSPLDEIAGLSAEQAADGTLLLAPGAWVEFYHDGQWTRVQLAWASPEGTMYMFQGRDSATHSMTRRLLEKLMREGVVIEITDPGIVEGALDDVAEAAMRNSVDLIV